MTPKIIFPNESPELSIINISTGMTTCVLKRLLKLTNPQFSTPPFRSMNHFNFFLSHCLGFLVHSFTVSTLIIAIFGSCLQGKLIAKNNCYICYTCPSTKRFKNLASSWRSQSVKNRSKRSVNVGHASISLMCVTDESSACRLFSQASRQQQAVITVNGTIYQMEKPLEMNHLIYKGSSTQIYTHLKKYHNTIHSHINRRKLSWTQALPQPLILSKKE